ncbi:hypothetical protein VTL71DRAFT_10912 [Oculimacula yallundae]|uniref:NmrA-like domain-containing protein n=1 Tax=Oculimacula yallundae TaxID=86028 RepID=A0ABR4CUF2_9HELO
MRRNILVTGATGKQGQALIKALLQPPSDSNSGPGSGDARGETAAQPDLESHTYHIYALTRNTTSPASKHLASLSSENLTLVQGDLDISSSIREIFTKAKDDSAVGGIWGVFAVLAYPGLGAEADGEEYQGKMLADLALEFGVECFVYSSVGRSGPEYEAELTLDRRAKRNVENHVRLRGLGWTILRPGFFMENFGGFIGSITSTVLKSGLNAGTTVGLIASEDVGNVAAAVFRDHEKYRSKILLVIAEYVTMNQMYASYQQAKGKPMPSVPGMFGKLLLKFNKATQELIEDIKVNHHARTTGQYPTSKEERNLAMQAYRMKSYEEWLVAGKDGKDNQAGWNQVSLTSLVTGKH